MLTNIITDLIALTVWEMGKVFIEVYKEVKDEKECLQNNDVRYNQGISK